jgi:hypothetical protein
VKLSNFISTSNGQFIKEINDTQETQKNEKQKRDLTQTPNDHVNNQQNRKLPTRASAARHTKTIIE